MQDETPLRAAIRTTRERYQEIRETSKAHWETTKLQIQEKKNELGSHTQIVRDTYRAKHEYRDFVLGGLVAATALVSVRRGVIVTLRNIVVVGGLTGVALYPDWVFSPPKF